MVKAHNAHYLVLLEKGLEKLSIKISGEQQKQLINYLEILAHWNQHINLTAIKSVEQMITHHLLDSLSIVKYIKGKRILDVGSGAGLPGCSFGLLFS